MSSSSSTSTTTRRQKEKEKESTSIQARVVAILLWIVYFFLFLFGGIYFCFLKIVFTNTGNTQTFRFEDFTNEFAPKYSEASKSSWTLFPSSSSTSSSSSPLSASPTVPQEVLDELKSKNLEVQQVINPNDLNRGNQNQRGGTRLFTEQASENRTIPSLFTRYYVPKQTSTSTTNQTQAPTGGITKEEENKNEMMCKQLVINLHGVIRAYFDRLCDTKNSYMNKIYLDISVMMMYLLYHFTKFLDMFNDTFVLCGIGWMAFFFFLFLLCPLFVGIFLLISVFRHSLLYGAILVFTGILSILFPFLYLFMLIQSFRLLLPSTGEQKMKMFELVLTGPQQQQNTTLDDNQIQPYFLSSFFRDFFQTNQTLHVLFFFFVWFVSYTYISSIFGNVILIMFLLYYFFYVKRNLSLFTKEQLLTKHWTTFTETMNIVNP